MQWGMDGPQDTGAGTYDGTKCMIADKKDIVWSAASSPDI
jgi:hypothetical protein